MEGVFFLIAFYVFFIAKDFSSEATVDGEPGIYKTISGASKTEKLGQKAPLILGWSTNMRPGHLVQIFT